MLFEKSVTPLGTLNDMWFGRIIVIGNSNPDSGEEGRYLPLRPDYDGRPYEQRFQYD